MMYSIGSGEVNTLLAKNKSTKTYHEFIKKFFGITKPVYNAYNSPIDHFRIGQILEDRYYEYLPDDWFSQFKTRNPEMPVLVSTLDFVKLEQGEVTEFQECKTIGFLDFIELPNDLDLKKKKRTIYNQVQHQLYTTGLEYGTVIFICVNNYDDEQNRRRVISDSDIKRYTVYRDEDVISNIIDAAKPFEEFRQQVIR